MTAHHAAVVGSAHRCYATDDGIKRVWAGCSHETPRAAIAHVANLDPFVSPLRDPSMGPDANTPVPLRAAGVGLIDGARERSAGSART